MATGSFFNFHPQFPLPRGESSPGTIRSPPSALYGTLSFHLGRAIHVRASKELWSLLSPFVPPSSKAVSCDNDLLMEMCSIGGEKANSLLCHSSSLLSFFMGGRSEENASDEDKLRFNTGEGNSSKTGGGPLWTNILLATNILLFGVQILTQGKLMLWGAKVNSLISQGQVWRLVTSSFLHANIMHLMVNSYSLNSIGPLMEKITGPRRFLVIYFSSAVAGSILSFRFCPRPSVGASGAIFGLVGSLAVFVLRHRKLMGGGKGQLQQIANVLAINMIIGYLSNSTDNWGHLGGLLGGAAISWLIGPAWIYQHQTNDGRLVFADRAPLIRFFQRKNRQ
ncbi:RHOMBOID-like protein 10, chloroplastic [Wolffia australiana]